MKKCSRCKIEKSLDYYHADRRSPLGKKPHCIDCERIAALEYRSKNRAKLLENKRLYYSVNKEKRRLGNHRRKAQKLNNGHSSYLESEVIELHGTMCHICSKEIDMTAPRRSGAPGWEMGLQIDHVISLASGGSDSIENVKPAHGICNLKKN